MHSRTITIIDPREFEGDPYQVAQRAVAQAVAIGTILDHNLTAVDLMARNAELERQLASGPSSDELRAAAQGWPESPQGRKLAQVQKAVADAVEALRALEKAVAYNPKAGRSRR